MKLYEGFANIDPDKKCRWFRVEVSREASQYYYFLICYCNNGHDSWRSEVIRLFLDPGEALDVLDILKETGSEILTVGEVIDLLEGGRNGEAV